MIITRFAPSPTGYLHLGGARTALFAYLVARQKDGKFLLRIEDTDQSRLVTDAVEKIKEDLMFLGLQWDGDIIQQSDRLEKYDAAVDQLLNNGYAYYCFCSAERLEEVRNLQLKHNEITRYDRACRNIPFDEAKMRVKNNEPYTVRLKMPLEGGIEFTDLIHGEVSFEYKFVEDQVLRKTDGFPTYHLALVVDDNEQNVTHVIRGDEWLPSVPKHLYLYKCFGFKTPEFAHLPVILGTDKKKLSKRDGAVSVRDIKARGFLPEAIINSIALLGWHAEEDRELYTLKDLVEHFSINRVQKSPAVFDREKLLYFNHHYLSQKSIDELVLLYSGNRKTDTETLKKVFQLTKERLHTLNEIDEAEYNYLFSNQTQNLDTEKIVFKKSTKENTVLALLKVTDTLQSVHDDVWENTQSLQELLQKIVSEHNLTNGDVMWPVRFALSGVEKSIPPQELLNFLGKNESIDRLSSALKKLI